MSARVTAQEIRWRGLPERDPALRLPAKQDHVGEIFDQIVLLGGGFLAEHAAAGEYGFDCVDHQTGGGQEQIAGVILRLFSG